MRGLQVVINSFNTATTTVGCKKTVHGTTGFTG